MPIAVHLHRAKLGILTRISKSLVAPRFEYVSETLNDRWVAEHVFPNKKNGFFVEAGAADGVGGSSCYVLEKELGWTGICIEPQESFFERLVRNRPKSKHEKVCLAGGSGTVAFVEGMGSAAAPFLSGVREHLANKTGGAAVIEAGRLVEKPTASLASILERHAAPATIDYGAFDIEGSELEVLRDFPFQQYTFRALSLECDDYIAQDIEALLARNGYRKVRNPFNRERPWERYWLHRTTA
jgi:FkbM family methyltransferase